jgi:vacuolar iron transporter family protein
LIHLEAHELATEPDEELEELAAIYRSKGMPPELATEVATALMRDPQIALETHAREELGLDPDGLGSPWSAAGSSFVTFAFGAFVPLVPFLITSGTTATVWSATLSALTLFVVGALVSTITGKRFWFAGLRAVLVGAAAATTTFLIGRLIDTGF